MVHPDRHKVVDLINRSLSEDIGSGDITSRAILEPGKITTAELIAKEDLVICGLWVFQKTFIELESSIKVKFSFNEGDYIEKGQKVAIIKGLAESILSAERTALNFVQRMSGIATMTKMFVEEVKHTKAVILDTRKTIPGLRILDKHAVATGGGENHRLGLFDMVIIKENHIAAAGGIEKAVNKVRDRFDNKFKLEIEVKNLTELKKVLPLKVDRILLDNMTLKDMQEAVSITNGKTKLEASGNVSLENVRSIAETGVDYISVGSLTHSVKAADLSLLIQS
jgi:nicotinate-nucleotide pyrophosphorylase (carboxylating)